MRRLSLVAVLAAGVPLWPALAAAQAEGPMPAPQPEGPMPQPPGPEGFPGDAAEPPPPDAEAEARMRPPPYDDYPPPVAPPPEKPPHLRKGPFGGVSIGLGGLALGCTGCVDYDGFGFGLEGGWAFSPKWAVVLELAFSGGLDPRNSDRGGQVVAFGIVGRYWAHERFWVQAGLSTASYSLVAAGQSDPLEEAGGGGLAIGLGAELWRSKSRHVVIDLRALVGFYDVESDGGTLGEGGETTSSLRQTNVLVQAAWY